MKYNLVKDEDVKEGVCSVENCGCKSTHCMYGTDGIRGYAYPLCALHAKYYRRNFEVYKD